MRKMLPLFKSIGSFNPYTMNPYFPTSDIIERDSDYLIEAELPRIEKEEIKVTCGNGSISVTAQSKLTQSKFSGQFDVPTTIDPKNVHATYKNGLLSITVKKGKDISENIIPIE